MVAVLLLVILVIACAVAVLVLSCAVFFFFFTRVLLRKRVDVVPQTSAIVYLPPKVIDEQEVFDSNSKSATFMDRRRIRIRKENAILAVPKPKLLHTRKATQKDSNSRGRTTGFFVCFKTKDEDVD